MLDMTPRKILVGVAGDEPTDAALELVAAEAVRRGCGVHLASVVHPVATSAEAASFNILEGTLHEVAASVLHSANTQLRSALGPDAAISTEVLHGGVVSALVDLSERAAVVVLQHHSPSRLGRVLTLSTTFGVAARAHVPVIAVPPGWHEQDPAHAPRPVVVGLSDAVTSEAVLRAGVGEARARQAPLRILHTWFYTEMYDDLVFQDDAAARHQELLVGDVSAAIESVLAEAPDVAAELVVRHARPADALVEESAGAALLVVGRHRSVTRLGPHLGSRVRSVLREARCPVMVVDPVAPDVEPAEVPDAEVAVPEDRANQRTSAAPAELVSP